MANDKSVLIYSTFPSTEEADRVAETLVSEGLAACVNIFPGMRSIFRWQGAIQAAEEVAAIVKTRACLADEAVARLCEAHSYETPAALIIPTTGGSEAFMSWIEDQTQSPAS